MKFIFFEAVSDLYGSSKIGSQIVKILGDADLDGQCFCHYEKRTTNKYCTTVKTPLLIGRELREGPWSSILKILTGLVHVTRILTRSDAKLVYLNCFGNLLIAMPAKVLRRKVILHVHESIKLPTYLRLLTHAYCGIFIDKMIFVSKAALIDFDPKNKMQNTKIIHNGIPANTDEAFLKQNRNIDILFVGRLIEKKGIHFFIKILQFLDLLLSEKIVVAIVGGELRSEAGIFSKLSGLSFEKIQLSVIGEVSNPDHYMKSSKVFVLPSIYSDPFPTVVLEAMRANCSIVTTSLGGAKEMVIPGVNHVLDPISVDQWAQKILKVLEEYEINNYSNIDHFSTNFKIENFELKLRKVINFET